MGTPTKTQKNEPLVKFKAGSISTSIWMNEAEKDGKKFNFMTVQMQRGYKDKNNEWVNEKLNLRSNDLPKAIICLQKAFEEVTFKENSED